MASRINLGKLQLYPMVPKNQCQVTENNFRGPHPHSDNSELFEQQQSDVWSVLTGPEKKVSVRTEAWNYHNMFDKSVYLRAIVRVRFLLETTPVNYQQKSTLVLGKKMIRFLMRNVFLKASQLWNKVLLFGYCPKCSAWSHRPAPSELFPVWNIDLAGDIATEPLSVFIRKVERTFVGALNLD